jgi:hypothetical protein
LRLDVRIPQDMYAFLEEQSRLKKLSFEGLVLKYVREQMVRESSR